MSTNDKSLAALPALVEIHAQRIDQLERDLNDLRALVLAQADQPPMLVRVR